MGTDYRVLQYNIAYGSFIWSENPESEVFKNQEIYFQSKKMDENNFLLYSRNNYYFYIWNVEKGFLDKFSIVPSEEFFTHSEFLRSKCLNTGELYNKNLKIFLKLVETQDVCEENIHRELTGVNIYRILSRDK